jgi:DNA-binding transcriptional ArsR family regulator
MNAEWPASVVARAQRHAALGEPARLAIIDRLLLGDASPGELGQELDGPAISSRTTSSCSNRSA